MIDKKRWGLVPARLRLAVPGSARPHRGLLERMPKWLICVPLVVQWIALGLRYRSFTLPSAANPGTTAGGLIGEGKLEYFRAMGPIARAATAPHCAVRPDAACDAAQLLRSMAGAALAFPVVAKPDLGLCGYGVRCIDDMDALMRYVERFPPGETFLLQQYLPQEGEAGIFYAPDPATGEPRIIGLALRGFPCVAGDGRRTVGQLMADDPRTRDALASNQHEFRTDRDWVPAVGVKVRLCTVGSTRVGGVYRNGAEHATPALLAAVDAIAQDMPDFWFGRFDVRFDSLQALGAGTGFCIMEINGAGSEAIEAWDPDMSLRAGLQLVFAKQRQLFAIADANRRRGHRPIGLLALGRLWRRQIRLLALYPPSN